MSTKNNVIRIAALTIAATLTTVTAGQAIAADTKKEKQIKEAVANIENPTVGLISPSVREITKGDSFIVPEKQPRIITPEAKYFTFAVKSKDANDKVGVEESLYRGKYYNKNQEGIRQCIVERESSGYYGVVNPSRSYFGAYQMSPELARGATWMMLPEHKKLLGKKKAKQILAKLRQQTPDKWNRYWQDAAFHTIANWEHTNSGIQHWAGGRWHC